MEHSKGSNNCHFKWFSINSYLLFQMLLIIAMHWTSLVSSLKASVCFFLTSGYHKQNKIMKFQNSYSDIEKVSLWSLTQSTVNKISLIGDVHWILNLWLLIFFIQVLQTFYCLLTIIFIVNGYFCHLTSMPSIFCMHIYYISQSLQGSAADFQKF